MNDICTNICNCNFGANFEKNTSEIRVISGMLANNYPTLPCTTDLRNSNEK